MLQPAALPRRALLHSFYIGGGINFMAKQRFLGSLDAHHVLSLPRVHGHDQQRRGMLLFTSCKGWSRLLHNPSLGCKEPFFQLHFPSQGRRIPQPPPLTSFLPHPFPGCFPFYPPPPYYFLFLFLLFLQPGKCHSFISSQLLFARTDPPSSFFKARSLLCSSVSFASPSPLPLASLHTFHTKEGIASRNVVQ